MAIVVEFTVPADLLAIGRALATDADQTAELERVVPTDESLLPYAWVYGGGLDAFESRLRADAAIADCSCLADVDGQRLYELTTSPAVADWLPALLKQEFAILHGTGTPDQWEFTLRFPDSEAARAFHQFVVDRDVPHTLERVHRLETVYPESDQILTTKQREALALAMQEGYFERPRGTTLAELGDELGITQSAASTRLRRGIENLLRDNLDDAW